MQTLILCVVIFCGRILDVTCCTLRTVLTVKEKTAVSACMGFFEAFLWFVIVRTALSSPINGIEVAISYGAGFAAGTFIGGKIAKRVIRSNVTLEIVTSERNNELVHAIRDAGYAVTVLNVNSSEYGGEKYMLFAEIVNTHLKAFKELVYQYDPKAFIMVQETKYVYNGRMVKK